MEKKELVCIVCPLGCKMQIERNSGAALGFAVEGHECKRGEAYAIEEFTNPTRAVTSTVVIHNAYLPRLPVKTNQPIPKGLIFACMEEIAKVEVTAPVKMGDVIIENLLGTDIDVVASRSLG
jgi:CxxC motif-containing protein